MKILTPSALASLAVVSSLAVSGCSEPAEPTELAQAPATLPQAPATLDQAPSNPPHGAPGHVHDDPLSSIDAPPAQRTGDPKEQIGTKPNSWFQWTELDMGSFFRMETATGTFPFKNPTAETRQLSNFHKTCQCTKSTWQVGDQEYVVQDMADAQNVLFKINYEDGARVPERVEFIEVGPGQSGSVTVEMEMSGMPSKQASLRFSIDDPELQAVALNFHATGAVYFAVTPEEVNLNRMRWDETREFTVQVTSPVMGDFEILRHEAPPGMKVTWEKSEVQGQVTYTIKGTYEPEGEAAGGTLVFYTDQDELSFDVRVMALVEGPLTMTPTFLALGRIPSDTARSRSTTLSAGEGFDLEVTGLEPKGLSFEPEFLDTSWKKNETGELVVTVGVLPGIPAGTVVAGELIIHLNHPAAPTKAVRFNGMVR